MEKKKYLMLHDPDHQEAGLLKSNKHDNHQTKNSSNVQIGGSNDDADS